MKKRFYDIKPIKEVNADFNLIYGQKGNGKTTTTLQDLLEECIRNNWQFVILRRWEEDFRGGRATTMFSDIASRGFIGKITDNKWDNIVYFHKAWYFCRYDEELDKRVKAEEPIAYARALTSYEHDNGNQYPSVHRIVFDEFITDKELPDEFTIFMKVYDNIKRRKDDFKVYMLGNTVNYFSTYWGNFGIDNIHKQQPGTIDVYTAKEQGHEVKVACEYCENIIGSEEKATISVFANKNPKLNMIVSGGWEIGSYPRPPKFRPKDILFVFFIQFYEYTFQCEIVSVDDGVFLNIHPKTGTIKGDNDIIYSNEYHHEYNYRRSLNYTGDKLGKLVTQLFNTDKVFYASNEVGNIIDSYRELVK